MPDASPSPILLDGIRVLDLATPRAELAGRLLADLGAEVIKVEPPGGAAARHMPPFVGDDPEGDSLYWAAVAMGKHSVVLDFEQSAADRAALLRLVDGADILIESGDPGAMAAIGLGFAQLAKRAPQLIYVSVTPYGQDGPWALRPATDLTLEAAGGLLGMQGDPDRPPVPVGYPQASFHAGIQAAADALVALNEREHSGLGQHLDVSTHAAMEWTLMNASGYPPNTGGDPPGHGAARAGREVTIAGLIKPCLDGWISFGIAPAGLGLRHAQRYLEWLRDEGELEGWPESDLAAWAQSVAASAAVDLPAATASLIPVVVRIAAFIAKRTKAELFAGAVARDVMLAPLYSMAEVANDPQLAARAFWVEVEGRRYPGPFAKLTRTPIHVDRPAPKLGEHQHLVGDPRASARARHAPTSTERRPSFEGLKVADFAWVGVGPLISKALADHGATVVRVESATRPDVLRLGPPFRDGVPGIDRSQFMANFNSSKLGLALNYARPEAIGIARKMVDWADVVVESFTPGTLTKLGLDYASLSRGRPDLLMLSTCMRGQTGPERTYAGFGLQGSCLSGIHLITGWPDRPPAGTWGAYTDFINPRYGLAVISAAIRHRALTGEGQHIDLAQSEAAINFVAPLLLDYTVNGRVAEAAGHDSLYACPHGVFQTEGVERYVAIAVETAAQWAALKSMAPLTPWAGPESDNLAARMRNKQAIEDAIRAWCLPQEPWALADALAAAGVPASVVERPSDLYSDPQLAHREFFVTLEHAVMGPTPYDGLVTRFSATPGRLRKAAPCVGEDTHYVLSEILGMDDDAISLAAAANALE